MYKWHCYWNYVVQFELNRFKGRRRACNRVCEADTTGSGRYASCYSIVLVYCPIIIIICFQLSQLQVDDTNGAQLSLLHFAPNQRLDLRQKK